MKRNYILLLAIILIGLVLVGCSGGDQQPGILEGHVTIGPLSPVLTPGPQPPVPCEAYEARKIMVYDKSRAKLIKQVDIDCDGHYRVELEPGVYTIDISRIGLDSSSDVPTMIDVRSSGTVKLDIDIDTGIR